MSRTQALLPKSQLEFFLSDSRQASLQCFAFTGQSRGRRQWRSPGMTCRTRRRTLPVPTTLPASSPSAPAMTTRFSYQNRPQRSLHQLHCLANIGAMATAFYYRNRPQMSLNQIRISDGDGDTYWQDTQRVLYLNLPLPPIRCQVGDIWLTLDLNSSHL